MNEELRPSVMHVDLSAIAHNIRQIKLKVDSDVQVMAVIKASGYGSGAVNIVNTLVENGANRVAVAIANEGIELRRHGVYVPINVLTQPFVDELENFVRYDLIPTIADYELALKFSEISHRMDKVSKIHVKVDTGMARIGIKRENAVEIIKKFRELPNIEIEGIFTHFACSEENGDYTEIQIARFNKVLSELEQNGIHIPLVHACNSAGIINYPQAHYNMVRPGLMLYGYYPAEDLKDKIDLKPSLTLKSKIIFIKEIPKGTSISYGRKFITQRISKIATVPLGYADGYRRELSNKGQVLINGVKAPVVGTVCMDAFMVDVTDIADVKVGDEVTIFDQGNITVEEIAKACNTINYEIITTVGNRVPRVYSY